MMNFVSFLFAPSFQSPHPLLHSALHWDRFFAFFENVRIRPLFRVSHDPFKARSEPGPLQSTPNMRDTGLKSRSCFGGKGKEIIAYIVPPEKCGFLHSFHTGSNHTRLRLATPPPRLVDSSNCSEPLFLSPLCFFLRATMPPPPLVPPWPLWVRKYF